MAIFYNIILFLSRYVNLKSKYPKTLHIMMLDYSNHFQIVTYLIYKLILSISILKQPPDLFCIPTQLHQDHYHPK